MCNRSPSGTHISLTAAADLGDVLGDSVPSLGFDENVSNIDHLKAFRCNLLRNCMSTIHNIVHSIEMSIAKVSTLRRIFFIHEKLSYLLVTKNFN